MYKRKWLPPFLSEFYFILEPDHVLFFFACCSVVSKWVPFSSIKVFLLFPKLHMLKTLLFLYTVVYKITFNNLVNISVFFLLKKKNKQLSRVETRRPDNVPEK